MGTIVAIECSPREHGNSSAIMDAVSDGAMGLSTNIIDLYRVSRFRYTGGCRGCHGCRETGRCVLNDDITDLLDRVREADVILLAVPVYFYGPCSQYKTVEDRMNSFLDRDLKSTLPPGKRAVVIVTCSTKVTLADKVAQGICQNLRFLGIETEAVLTYSDDNGRRPASEDDEILALAKAVGLRFRNT